MTTAKADREAAADALWLEWDRDAVTRRWVNDGDDDRMLAHPQACAVAAAIAAHRRVAVEAFRARAVEACLSSKAESLRMLAFNITHEEAIELPAQANEAQSCADAIADLPVDEVTP